MVQQQANNASGRCYDVTEEEVRGLPTFKDYSNEQIAQLLYTIKAFTQIVHAVWAKKNLEEGRIVSLTVIDEKRKAA